MAVSLGRSNRLCRFELATCPKAKYMHSGFLLGRNDGLRVSLAPQLRPALVPTQVTGTPCGSRRRATSRSLDAGASAVRIASVVVLEIFYMFRPVSKSQAVSG